MYCIVLGIKVGSWYKTSRNMLTKHIIISRCSIIWLIIWWSPLVSIEVLTYKDDVRHDLINYIIVGGLPCLRWLVL